MSLQFKAVITQIGEFAPDALKEGMLILFNQSAPDYAAEYCFIHDQGTATGLITIDSTLMISDKDYIVTSVGSVASKNLMELGHITIKFDARLEPEFPGTIHVNGHCPASIKQGDTIIFG